MEAGYQVWRMWIYKLRKKGKVKIQEPASKKYKK